MLRLVQPSQKKMKFCENPKCRLYIDVNDGVSVVACRSWLFGKEQEVRREVFLDSVFTPVSLCETCAAAVRVVANIYGYNKELEGLEVILTEFNHMRDLTHERKSGRL